MILQIKKILKSNAFGRWLFPKIGYFWHLYKEPARKRALQKYGLSILKEVMEIAEKENMKVIPWAGTILGFERDGGFMKHDNDIDFALLPSIDPKQLAILFVEKYGFKFNYALSFNGQIQLVNVLRHGLGIDFYIMRDEDGKPGFYRQYDFLWFPDHEYEDPSQNHVRQYSYPKVTGLTTKDICGVDVKMPINIEEELYYLYGKGWKVPDPNYKGEGRPGCLGIIEGYGYSMSYDDLVNDRIHK